MTRQIGNVVGVAASGALAVGTAAVAVLTGYLAALTLGAAARRPPKPGAATPPPPSRRRFAILVPAHDEELVIGRALDSFAALDYPSDLFQVHVVADNCSDRTADIVRAAGFHVHERVDAVAPGKGPALNWVYQRVRSSSWQFEAVVIVDADTTLHPAFLRHIAAELDGGALALQAFYGVRDAGDSAAAALRFAALACRHHVRPLGRTALGGSCGLFGNGMVFATELMDGLSWTGHLTEDMEFQMELLLDGHRVGYVPGATLEAEMPGTLDAAASQNERWELGRIEMARRYVPVLARRAVRQRRHRAASVDAVLDHLVPPLSVLIAANAICGTGSLAMAVLARRRVDRVNLAVSAASSAAIVGHVLFGLRSVDAPPAIYRALWKAPRLIVWKVALWRRVLDKPADVEWTRTTRNSEAE